MKNIRNNNFSASFQHNSKSRLLTINHLQALHMHFNNETALNNIGGQSQLLVAAVSASMSGIVITDYIQHDNPIIFCNKAFEEMTGYTRAEVIGKNCRFLQSDDDEQIGRFKIKEALCLQEECHVELANYRKDGSIFFNELYLAPIKNEKGITTHFIGVQNDITASRLKEASLVLEQQNEKKLALRKVELISLICQELKTPVTRLKLTLQLMNRILSEDLKENIKLNHLSQNAESYSNSLAYLIDEILKTA